MGDGRWHTPFPRVVRLALRALREPRAAPASTYRRMGCRGRAASPSLHQRGTSVDRAVGVGRVPVLVRGIAGMRRRARCHSRDLPCHVRRARCHESDVQCRGSDIRCHVGRSACHGSDVRCHGSGFHGRMWWGKAGRVRAKRAGNGGNRHVLARVRCDFACAGGIFVRNRARGKVARVIARCERWEVVPECTVPECEVNAGERFVSTPHSGTQALRHSCSQGVSHAHRPHPH